MTFCMPLLWACRGSESVSGPSVVESRVTTQSTCAGAASVSEKDLSVDWAGRTSASPLTVAVSATDQRCTWTATVTEGTFVTIVEGGSGTGDGSVRLAIARNTGGSRVAKLAIATVTVTLTQREAPCDFAVTGDTRFPAGGDRGTINVAVAQGADCVWTATSHSSFITLPAGAGGTGAGAVTFTIAANPSTQTRTGSLTVAGKTVTVIQDGQPAPPPPPTPPPPRASRCDLNGDGVVNGADLVIIREAIHDESTDPRYDLNRDGEVNFDDLQIIINAMSDPRSCPP